MAECQHCRQTVLDAARFCENCGAPLTTESLDPELMHQIGQLLANGQKIEAIRVLREATGIGLAEAKHLVESESFFRGPIPAGSSANEEFQRDLLELLRGDRKLEAIKRYRERTGTGLKDAKDHVESLARQHGIVCRRSGCAGVLLAALLAVIGFSRIVPAGQPTQVETRNPTTDGWKVHPVTSVYQAAPTEIKVLPPDRIEPGKRYRVLYVLPVEARNEHRYGDGLAEIKRCGIHNRYGLICVAPTFAHLPWYADHPTDASIRQESYFVKDVVPQVDRLYPTQADRDGRWLLGFSKSGWGACSLLARHPDLFGRAAAWDAPLDMPRFDQYGAGPIFGTQAHFETYRVLPALKNCAALAQGPPRLVLIGYDNFRSHHATAHRLLDEWRIPHVNRDGPHRKHVWNSGWVEEAVELLAGTTQ